MRALGQVSKFARAASSNERLQRAGAIARDLAQRAGDAWQRVAPFLPTAKLLSLWRHTYPELCALWVFTIVWNDVHARWRETAGRWADERSWPVYRTRFVLALVAVPIWAAVMVALTIIWRLLVPVAWSYARRRRLLQDKYVSLPMHATAASASPHVLGRTSEDSDDSSDDPAANSRRGSEADTLFERDVAPVPQPTQARRRFVFRAWWLRLVVYLSLVGAGWYLWDTREWAPDWKYREQIDRAARTKPPAGLSNGEHVYLVAMFHNNADVLPFWKEQMTRVIYYLGTKNVYVSIVESYSNDNSAQQLEEFEQQLSSMGVDHGVRVRDTSITKNMTTDRRHIRFLSDTRNLAMQPLRDLAAKGRLFHRVLWSNDVFVHAEAVVELLKTNKGNYDQACGVDFNFFGLYDMWVLRDRLGGIGTSMYPFVFEELGMRMVMRDEPAPVFSCWNGILAAAAEPFVPPQYRLRNATRLSQSALAPPLPPSHPQHAAHATTPPFDQPALMFRDSAPDECFSSESFNMPYDLRRQFRLEKIYMLPSVITTYHYDKYIWFKFYLRHWAVQWYMKNIENGYGMHLAKTIIGPAESVYVWDGGQCMAPGFTLGARRLRRRSSEWT
ncbi:hypothetical protein AURDEDRAFT_114248 [Auricularia subglabra TFB-10046 SS5]|nr:hypothetical protein AURDEDRAFT_114248 [Auricularia subglabra TFB-10046 SS5]